MLLELHFIKIKKKSFSFLAQFDFKIYHNLLEFNIHSHADSLLVSNGIYYFFLKKKESKNKGMAGVVVTCNS